MIFSKTFFMPAIIVLASLLAASPARAHVQDQTNRAKAEQLWEQAIKAKGGRERLHSVDNVLRTANEKYWWWLRRLTFRYEALFVFPGKSWEWDDQRGTVFGFTIRLHNFEKNIHQSYNRSGVVVEIERPNQVELMTFQLEALMETRWIKPIPQSVRTEKYRGRSVDIVTTSVSGLKFYSDKVEFFLDQKKHLPVRVLYHWTTADGRELSGGIDLSDYETVDGITAPMSLGRMKTRYDFNVNYDEAVFQNTPNPAAGIYAWKKK